MEPRNEESKKSPEVRKEAKKSRFQIVKLEERIAPGCKFNPNAGPQTFLGYYGGKVKYGKYVGKC